METDRQTPDFDFASRHRNRLFFLGVRVRTLCIALFWAGICTGAAHVIPKFAAMFQDMNLGSMPTPTLLLLWPQSFGWALLGFGGAVLIIKKDFIFSGATISILNAVSMLAVLLMCPATAIAFFGPLIGIIEGI